MAHLLYSEEELLHMDLSKEKLTHTPSALDVAEKEEVVTVEKKEKAPPKKRRRTEKSEEKAASADQTVAEVSQPSVSGGDQWAVDFLNEYLSDIKKEQKEKQRTMFSLADLANLKPIFKKASSIRPAYCLPYFNFCHSLSLLCKKVQVQGKTCRVYTEDNMRRLEVYEKMDIADKDLKALYEKFKWSWVKIPFEDAALAKEALESSKSTPRSFYVILRGVKNESFFDEMTGEKVEICRPNLEYSSVN